MKEITEAGANTLEVERVGVWLYAQERSRLECIDGYERTPHRHTSGMELLARDYPVYFRVLSSERILASENARQDPRTLEFLDGYLMPFGITSMLEAPIRLGGQMVGVLCHEHTGEPRQWAIEEQNFAGSLADLVALAIERDRRAKAEQERDRFFSVSLDLLCVLGFDGYFQQLNPAWEKTLSFSIEELKKTPFLDLLHPEDVQPTLDVVGDLKSGKNLISFANRYRCANGSYRWLLWNATAFPEQQLIYAGAHDITKLKQAEEALQKANEELEMRVEERTVELKDAIDSLRDTNAQLHDEIAVRKRTEEALRRSKAQLKQQTEELQTALDKLQLTQMQLVQNEKMASLGQLVAGIAHEINNPVSFIYSNIEPARQYIEDLLHLLALYQEEYSPPSATIQDEEMAIELEFLKEDLPKLLQSMKQGADRIRKIVVSLRNFSRLDEAEKKWIDIRQGIESTLLILQHRFNGIDVIKDFADIPQIECYSAQLNQVFMNILSNAIDAVESSVTGHSSSVTNSNDKGQMTNDNGQMTNDNGQMTNDNGQMTNDNGQKTIRIRTETLEEAIAIYIADNGPGIPEEIKPRIFDPFFTTKAVGKGTGLGLSVSYQIVVEKHGGDLQCSSQPGRGSEFIIRLPLQIRK
jgi:PAS domain S-box-containing protein